MQIHITQHIDTPPDKVGTSNAIIKESIISGEAKGYENAGAAKPKSEAEIKNEKLNIQLQATLGRHSLFSHVYMPGTLLWLH
jgi:hypothetical protein